MKTLNFSVHEVAAVAGTSEKTIRNLIARGQIRVARVGRAVRIPASELERLGLDVPDKAA